MGPMSEDKRAQNKADQKQTHAHIHTDTTTKMRVRRAPNESRTQFIYLLCNADAARAGKRARERETPSTHRMPLDSYKLNIKSNKTHTHRARCHSRWLSFVLSFSLSLSLPFALCRLLARCVCGLLVYLLESRIH